MYIKGDIFINPSYPLYFGIGYKRLDERIKGILDKFFVKTVSVQNIDVPKDGFGNVNLQVPTLQQFQALSESINTQLKNIMELINNDKDELYKTSYNPDTKTLTIIQKPINNGEELLSKY